MKYLFLLRHGRSVWNEKNLFTGWVDVPLHTKGVEEAMKVQRELAQHPIDVVYTSTLVRAQQTACLALLNRPQTPYFVSTDPRMHCEASDMLPVVTAWQLNERHYGALQGMNKTHAEERWGKEQVHRWRRGFSDVPPDGESLEQTAARTVPYFEREIVAALNHKHVLIVAHGNSLRSIVQSIEGLSADEVVSLEIQTGDLWIYTYNVGAWKRIT